MKKDEKRMKERAALQRRTKLWKKKKRSDLKSFLKTKQEQNDEKRTKESFWKRNKKKDEKRTNERAFKKETWKKMK